MTAVLGALGVVGERKQRILTLAKGASKPGWITYGPSGMQLTAVIECEKAAKSIVEWSPTVIPGLLQTPGYARAMFTAYGGTAEEADRKVALRMKRAEMLGADRTFEAIIGEAALHNRIGTPTTMFDQLHSLIEKSTRSVTVRVVPAACGWHPGLAGPFLLYSLTDGTSVVYLEHLSCGAFVLDGHDVGVYRAALKTLRALAMSETDSKALIGRLADEMEGVELSALAGE